MPSTLPDPVRRAQLLDDVRRRGDQLRRQRHLAVTGVVTLVLALVALAVVLTRPGTSSEHVKVASTSPLSTAPPTTKAALCTSYTKAGCKPDQPLTVKVIVSPPRPQANQAVTFDITASDPDAIIVDDPCPSHAFGDETSASGCSGECSGMGPTTFEPAPGLLRQQFTHVYVKAGTYTAKFTYLSGDLCRFNPYGDTATATVTVVVT